MDSSNSFTHSVAVEQENSMSAAVLLQTAVVRVVTIVVANLKRP